MLIQPELWVADTCCVSCLQLALTFNCNADRAEEELKRCF